jgi:hypothetical protein
MRTYGRVNFIAVETVHELRTEPAGGGTDKFSAGEDGPMTGRERFLAVLNGEMPDRVPITLFLLDQGHFLNQLYPTVDPEDFETLHLKVVEAHRQFGVDIFARLLFGLNDPLSIHMGGLNVSTQTDCWEVD